MDMVEGDGAGRALLVSYSSARRAAGTFHRALSHWSNVAIVERSVLVEYTAGQMYALVDCVERYPEFLPWCGGAVVQLREPGRVLATVQIAFRGVRHAFSTENTTTPDRRIDIRLVDGPFRQLDGAWVFTPLGETACNIQLRLHYEFSSRILEKLVGPVFDHIAGSFVDAFVARAAQVHGPRP
jgi:ribosome-associated toxin RatA of RatAB toxin-antitoxin module